jgi:glutamate-5-semialdehyde dehydrogenase
VSRDSVTPQEINLRPGDRVLVGSQLLTVDDEFASSLQPGDVVLGVAHTGQLRRIPAEVAEIVDRSVRDAVQAFAAMSAVTDEQITHFFEIAARLLADDDVFARIRVANDDDVANAQRRGRSTTRLLLSDSMRRDMIEALLMWRSLDVSTSQKLDVLEHDGWAVEQWRSPLGCLGFVFEGRPNVFADATGVLRTGNTVVFRIGSDALGTAIALMSEVITPALTEAGLPIGAVSLVDSSEHAAGWALFSDSRLSLAVARGSGEAVAELGAIAQQAGIPVSLHGTGGAWLIAGNHADVVALADAVQYSLDRKVCNTANVVCVLRDNADSHVPAVYLAAEKAAAARSSRARIHCVGGAEKWLDENVMIDVKRATGITLEPQVSVADVSQLSHEWEWEETPEFFLAVVDDLKQAIEWCNKFSPQFVVSVISEDQEEQSLVWATVNAPFVGNGFTRWVDGQFALQRPELGLSNWQHGRLFGRGGVLSGDSAFTVRLKVVQSRSDVHR